MPSETGAPAQQAWGGGGWRRGRTPQPRLALRPVHLPALRLGLQLLVLHQRESEGSLRLLLEALTPTAGVPVCSAGCPRGCGWRRLQGLWQQGWGAGVARPAHFGEVVLVNVLSTEVEGSPGLCGREAVQPDSRRDRPGTWQEDHIRR